MLVSNILALATVALAAPVEQTFNGLYVTCKNKNADLFQAINNFCGNNDIQVPSSYGLKGATVGNSVAWIRTQDGCPTSFVPQKYCYQQFYEMCVGGDSNGYNMNWYGVPGGDKCQVWFLNTQGRHDLQCKDDNC